MEANAKTIPILLIDDDEDDTVILRGYISELSGQAKYVLDSVASYEDGLTQILRANHDIYLIDHNLGERTGLELLKEAIQAGCQAPLIIITGLSDPEIDQAALLAGAADFLFKDSLDGQLLERSIRYALERNRLLQNIRDLAVRDSLTGLYNRRELDRFVDYEIIKSQRYNHPFSLLMMDIDHFKAINDRLGHRVGDEILQNVAQALLTNVRGCDLAARYGGDEFIIVFPETSGTQAILGAERLRKIVAALSIVVRDKKGLPEKIDITVSIGVAEYPRDAKSIDLLYELVDQALYQAKLDAGNRVMRLNPEAKKKEERVRSGSIQAMLIEDDLDDILLLQDSLKEIEPGKIRLGHADRLSRGLRELSEQTYDVILLDLNLPDSHGLDTLKTVAYSYPRIPIVVLSGLADDATTTEAIRQGAQDYLIKGEIDGPLLARVLQYAIDRKKAEDVLRASETRYRTLVETSPNGITVTDLEGKLVLCNQQTANLHGFGSPEEMVALDVYDLIDPVDRERSRINSQKTLDEGRIINAEYTFVRKDGSHFPAELSAALLRDSVGTPAGFIAITRDITERKRSWEAEKRLIRLREEFIASVSHELRTPLFSLMGYIDLLLKGKAQDAEVQTEFLTRASLDANRLLDMVNELLDSSLLERQNLVLNQESVDLVPIIENVLHSLQEKAEFSQISITPVIKNIPLVADVDTTRMRRVLVNLVENAIKYSEKGSEVIITGESLNGNIVINIIDHGCGIAVEEKASIFEKYYRSLNTHQENTSGTGLGLYIAKEIIEAHAGTITVESELGEGSTFTITLPMNKRM
jgi:two-component system cell cycle response regulator